MSEFKQGELIVFKTHPYINKLTNIKITAYSDYSSPVLVVKEIKEKSFDKESGVDIGQQLNCIYYNSKEGKFTEKWINSNLVNRIFFSIIDQKFLFEINFKQQLEDENKELTSKNYENLIKQFYINKKVVLKSVDIELNKVKVNRTKDNGELMETNHLEFLPPIMTIIGFKFSDEKNKFSEKSGLPIIELKCKWYNSNSKSFSELYLSSETLYEVRNTQDLFPDKDLLSDVVESVEKNSYFNLPILPLNNSFILEGSPTKISKTLGLSKAILFKHYFYQMNYFDYVAQKKSAITINDNFSVKTENEIFGKKFPDYNSRGYKLKTFDCKFTLNGYYYIRYKDTYHNITTRIVKIIDLFIYIKDFKKFKDLYKNLNSWISDGDQYFVNYNYNDNGSIFINLPGEIIPDNTLPKTIFEDQNVEVVLKTNCLLRDGKIRNFKISSILEIQEIINGQGIFED
ncbi:hypothetical protein GKZ90_0005800 [Flavobacterium sp. MC2016-06]|uniref:hypothetical protein n=1 Tax=Flavobacterium sp. MC2016-06 TaxID=2676308 RepID=UPI0012BAD4D0|nr:hypothetical protein [Flavobacterium sp. MC2016-06]MBU3857651.1 hypothetical protein [Flavobacterium sp. MC2016-06]